MDIIEKHFGAIELGNKVVVSDPCYSRKDSFVAIPNMEEGLYDIYVGYCLYGKSINIAYLKAVKCENRNDCDLVLLGNGDFLNVDCGMGGIFDEEFFNEHHFEDSIDEKWYKTEVCERNEDSNIFEKGFICNSGFGDGDYDVYGDMNCDLNIEGIEINFIWPENGGEYNVIDTLSNEEDVEYDMFK